MRDRIAELKLAVEDLAPPIARSANALSKSSSRLVSTVSKMSTLTELF